MIFNFYEPVAHAFEGLAVGDIKDDKDSIGLVVKESRNRPETFLTRSVPNLQLDVLLASHDHSKIAEFDANRNVVLGLENLMDQPRQDARLPNTCVADNDDFE